MKILNEGFPFKCNCGLEGNADLPNDFFSTDKNGEKVYFVVCPNCKKKIEILEDEIPTHIIKQHIPYVPYGLGYIE